VGIKITPVVKSRIVLAEVHETFANKEGECPDDERAWVSVKQAAEMDNIDVEEQRKNVRFSYDEEGRPVEQYSTNVRKLWAMQAYRTLTDSGNISGFDGKPLFEFEDTAFGHGKVKGGYQDFLDRWGQLPSYVTGAIMSAIYELNPDWKWWESGE
jgi:YD repeat-containing protein